MKQAWNWVCIALITALCLSLCFFAFFGITTHYGDVDTIVLQSPEHIRYDADLTETSTYIFKPSSAEGTDIKDEDLDQAKSVFEKRLEYIGINTYDVYCDYSQKQLIVTFANSSGVSVSWLVSNLAAKGDVYARAENNSEASAAYIFSSDEVKSAKVSVDNSFIYPQYNVEIKLNKAGKDALKTTTNFLAEQFKESNEEDVQYIYFFNGTTSLGSKTISEPINNGTVMFSSYNLDADTVVQVGMFMNSGKLPFSMTYDYLTTSYTTLGQNNLRILLIALGSAVAAIFLFLIARYGYTGVAGAICALGTAGVSMLFITGAFNGSGYAGSYAALAGYLLILWLSIETTIRSGNKIKHMLASNSVEKSISASMKAMIWPTIRVYAIALLVGCVMIMCRHGNFIGNVFLSVGLSPTYMEAVNTFGSVIVSGVFASFLFSVLGVWAMMLLFKNLVTKPRVYGGVESDA